ncbi:MAG: endopeptidase La [Rickettsiales bacterium]|nr:endopeptidase La [Rickettsiales bacterium]
MVATKNNKKENQEFYALPLRDVVVFPDMIFPLFVGRTKSVIALEKAMEDEKELFLVTQKSPSVDDVTSSDLYQMGALARIIQLLKLPDGTLKVLIETKSRAKMVKFSTDGAAFMAEVGFVSETNANNKNCEALRRSIVTKFKEYIKLEERIPTDLVTAIIEIKEFAKLSDHIISSLPLKIEDKQKGLEELNIYKRLEYAYKILGSEYQILETESKIRNRIKSQVENSQREYYLNEQLKAIKKELGDSSVEEGDEIKVFEALIKKSKCTVEAKKKAESELRKLKTMNPMASEAGIVRSYLEWLLHVPWKKPTKLTIDLERAEAILGEKHYGLEKVKEKIVEYIAVNKRVGKIKGSILCLVGPPGVGKTSLGRSIADSMGRKFVKMSLGGIRDESEIRGHRRTYIGALPGKIIQQMKKAGTSNPLFLLDEIDKMGSDFRGDPASALLEVLDPEQNNSFNDHYLEVDYDLSDVLFVTTANSLDIPHALRDRMEVIRLSGYTEDEKLEIAKRFLLPKQIINAGLKEEEINVSDDAITEVIKKYTYEAGVRNLEREISSLTRKITKKIDTNTKISKVSVNSANIKNFLGVAKYDHGKILDQDRIGVSTGLAYTEFGGDVLSIESVRLPGKSEIEYTGKLGDVMKESIQAAYSYFRSTCLEYGVTSTEIQKSKIHIHVPEGATPKDGPSAGVAICTSIVSLMTGIPISKYVAMTGEITLRGRILPIGGLKEKLLAAKRAGIKTVLIPKQNEKDLAELAKKVTKGLKIITVSEFSEVIPFALTKIPKKIKVENQVSSNSKAERLAH